ncbi:leucine--tRNA ligase [Leptospira idonii]|uniref:Leucine--tRNA ligase n=1 Tax=Leptospira idonii TaxID=1193500 RepID=A0A4R9M2C0_9LEPT|nr:leucine--tRNA ligase [Leptospira idonii]TGN20900.1 leucine--tRNA ligase [Leptospira idonii]
MSYPFQNIEPKWQTYWDEKNTFRTNPRSSKPKYYCLDMFPYPSGAGLHVGHPEGYTATDILSRLKRMQGFEVLHPMGWDAFGLPAERYAMTTGVHPRVTTKNNIDTFRRQIKMLGLSYDWSREISTTDPEYYRWTQWIFLQIYNSYFDRTEKKAKSISFLVKDLEQNGSKSYEEIELPKGVSFSGNDWKSKSRKEKEDILSYFRLVYEASIPVNWCEALGTVLANEEVEEWTSKGYSVERKPMRQYMMRITSYAERLLNDLSLCEWPISTLEMQRNWIGKSEGLEIEFPLETGNKGIVVYTTRPDTIFGATYLVLAPEHPLVPEITISGQKAAVETYQKDCALKSDLERTELNKDKSGVFTGAYATLPTDPSKKIPIYISDYVLYGYGTGAIMAVPAHDQRDYDFAVKFKLPIIPVIQGEMEDGKAFDSKDSVCINSSSSLISLDGKAYKQAFDAMSDWAQSKGIGKRKIQFKLRDWLFARQRYWGEPIPLVHFEDGTPKALSDSELPLVLPDLEEFKPSGTGESPLALAKDWLVYKDPETGEIAKRETNTMPQWAGSCWYYLRYIDPKNTERLIDPELEKTWMPVEIYVGGAEHAVLHLLYSRFWHKILFDLGHVSTPEPFQKLVHQGLILGEDKGKMSKSRGNVVNPDDVVNEFGADTLRLFEMFMGPFEMSKPWSKNGVDGVFRFLNRVWRLFHSGPDESFLVQDIEPNEAELKTLHRSLKKIKEDIEGFAFNTAVSQMMIFVNEFTSNPRKPKAILEPFILALSPFAPHLAEEIWEKLGHKESLAYEPYPSWDEKYLVDSTITIVVQINGKMRGEFTAPRDVNETDAISLAKQVEKALPFWQGKEIKKEIYVKGKLVNLVVTG